MKQLTPNTIPFLNIKQNLKVYNRILKRSICEAKSSLYYYTKFNQCKSDSQKTWKYINDVLHRNGKMSSLDYMNIDQKRVKDIRCIANHFNDYFCRIGSSMASTIPSVDKCTFTDYLKFSITTTFNFKPVTDLEVSKIIQQLKSKSSTGHDEISNNLLKYLEPLLSKPIALIINQSLASGIFPEKLKLANIIPVHKKDDIHKVENYRPISILPAFSKIFEKAVFDQLYLYFTQNNLLCKSQYGFRKQHSTQHAVLEAVDRISTDMDIGNTPMAIYLDFSKAFDTLDHQILLSKLRYYGVEQSSLKWFNNYLSERSHYVEIGQCDSKTVPISIGVPQGSILGPLLFSIYINDIQNCSEYFKCVKYADDTSLLNPSFNIDNYDLTTVNDELNKVYIWLCINRLSLNIKKTKYMIFHNKNKPIDHSPIININNISVDRVTDFNFLGITLDEQLNWRSHINKISAKISKSIGILYKLKHFLPLCVLKMLYHSLILPHLSYGILLWGYNINRLHKLQKKVIRIISNNTYIAHTEPIFKTLCLLKLSDIYALSILKFYYQYCHGQLPFYLQSFVFKQRMDMHQYNTRNKTALNVARVKTKVAENSLKNITPKIVNDTPEIILDKIFSHSLQGFVDFVKQYYISLYTYDCSIRNCYVCNSNL